MTTAKRKVIGIAVITAAALLGDSMLIIALPVFWQDFGLTSLWQIGILLSINRFVRLPINPLVGMFYQRFELRTGVLIALLIAIGTTASYGIFKEFWVLFLMRLFWGIAWSLLRLGGFLTVVEVTTEHNRGNLVGLYNGLWGIGGLVGMLGGGILVDQTSIMFVTSLFAALGLLVLPAVFFLIPLSKTKHQEKVEDYSHKKWLTLSVGFILITSLMVGFIIFGLFASTLSTSIETKYFNNWSVAQFTIGSATIAGIIQALRWGWDPFLAPKIGKMIDSSRKPNIFIIIPLIIGSLLLYGLGQVRSIIPLLVLLLLFQLISTIIVTTTDTIAVQAASKTNKVKVMTAHTIVVDVGAALGPLLAFLLMSVYNLAVVYYLSGLLFALLGVSWITLILMKKKITQ
ncbi:MFS transporter [Gracilibacillus sp. HCP3S3_G5_1]|uniref:MFS transporter n=1 Tax=unclassified Gracilibacillus TaxID=2625209 RepID=UPI003F8C1333